MKITTPAGTTAPPVHRIAHILTTAGGILGELGSTLLAHHADQLAKQVQAGRIEAAALAHRAYFLGRFHHQNGVPLPADVVRAAATLDPETAATVVDIVRQIVPAAADVDEHQDHAAAAADVDEAAADVAGVDEHQDHAPAAAAAGALE